MINIRDRITVIQNGTGVAQVVPLDEFIEFIKKQVVTPKNDEVKNVRNKDAPNIRRKRTTR